MTDPGQWLSLYGDSLWRFALSRVRDRDAAEELVQEALLSALQSRDRFAGQSAELTWLTGILNHKILDYFRRKARRGEVSADGVMDDEGETPMSQVFTKNGHYADPFGAIAKEDDTLVGDLDDCTRRLPQTLQRAWVLREVRGVKSEAVCDELGITPTNLWTRLSRARNLLRDCLQGKEKDRKDAKKQVQR